MSPVRAVAVDGSHVDSIKPMAEWLCEFINDNETIFRGLGRDSILSHKLIVEICGYVCVDDKGTYWLVYETGSEFSVSGFGADVYIEEHKMHRIASFHVHPYASAVKLSSMLARSYVYANPSAPDILNLLGRYVFGVINNETILYLHPNGTIASTITIVDGGEIDQYVSSELSPLWEDLLDRESYIEYCKFKYLGKNINPEYIDINAKMMQLLKEYMYDYDIMRKLDSSKLFYWYEGEDTIGPFKITKRMCR